MVKINTINFSHPYYLKSANSKNSNKQKYDKTCTNEISNISFEGITRKMNKHTYIDGQRDIKPIVEERKDKNLMVGTLPDFMIKKLPKENRKECIQEIYNTFAQITQELRDFDETKVFTVDEIMKRRNNSTKELFENLMRKYKFVGPWDDVDIEYLGKGGKGAGYKLIGLRNPSMNEDEYVIKVYHLVEGRDWQPYKSHGAYAEINSAAYWMNTNGYETDRGKFFFGDLKSGYMVIKYVDDDVRLPKKKVDPYRYGLKCTDEDLNKKHNVCKEYKFDWGGVRVINRIKNGNKTARYVLERIKDTPMLYRRQEWERINASKKLDKSGKYAGLAISIKHLPKNERNKYIDRCLKSNEVMANRGLAYVLKYLPYKDAIKYFEKLAQTNDSLTQVILFNEIPLLAMKHHDDSIKDDLGSMSSEILPDRVLKYYDIAEKYANEESIEHLASYLHLLPDDKFKEYYARLASIDNYALHDRLIYKLTNVDAKNKFFAIKNIAKNLREEKLKETFMRHVITLPDEERKVIENILEENFS